MMHARNLGVVFGRKCTGGLSTTRNADIGTAATLMRSPDPSAEFSDMAGKALCVEWLVENAPRIFDAHPIQLDD